VQRHDEIDRGLEALRVRQGHVREQLRLAYDWEIGQLIQHLDQQPDQGLLAQLMVYQEEREGLGIEPEQSELQYGAEMAISPTDGPDEIRQKMELMEGIAARLEAEAASTRGQLVRLEAEQRLRTRVRVFASEIALFDEHLAEGRVLVRAERAATGEAEGDYQAPSDSRDIGSSGIGAATNEGSGERPAQATVRGALQAAGEGELRGLAVDDDVALEIQKLRARQQEVRQLEVLARERAASFRICLNEMLEGSD
jgi:hypothetical protein